MADELEGVGGVLWGAGAQSFRTSTSVSLCPAEASEIMKSIGEAIQYLHSINIAHRDVKVPPVYAP